MSVGKQGSGLSTGEMWICLAVVEGKAYQLETIEGDVSIL